MGIFNLNSPFMQKLALLFDLMVLNLLTILCSLPIVTMGAAISALHDAAWRLRQHQGTLLRNYFTAFRRNFRQATIMFIPLLLIGLAFAYNAVVVILNYQETNSFMLLPLGICFAIYVMVASWVYPLHTRFENTTVRVFVNSFLCALRYLPRTLIMAVMNLLPWAALILAPEQFSRFFVLWAFVWFAFAAYMNMWLLEKPIQRLTELSEAAQAAVAESEEEESAAEA